MKGDFSRRVLNAGAHYAGVLHQQGRVWLDSDWNEEVAEQLSLLRQETTDVVGVCGVPEPGAAFLISANPSVSPSAPGDFLIGGGAGNLGRAYVDGIMCQLDAPATYLTQPDLPVPPAIVMPTDGSLLEAVVYLEVWDRLITALEDPTLREVALGGPDTTTRVKTIAQVRAAVVPQTSPPTPVSNGNAAQFLPQPSGGTLTTLQPKVTPTQDQCQLPDANNFTGRQNRLYRVEIHEGGDPVGSVTNSVLVSLTQDASAGATSLRLAQALTASQMDTVTRWGAVTLVDNTGKSERAPITSISNDGKTIALSHGLANTFALADKPFVAGVARFKWSRDNASFAVGLVAVSADRQTLTLASLGRDQATALGQGDLVEISDDASELGVSHGHLTNLQSDPDPDQLTVVLADPLPLSFQLPGGSPSSPPGSPPSTAPDRHLILRRWDGQGIARTIFSETETPDMDLGDGVQIQFGGLNMMAGDFWNFTARSTDGSIEQLVEAPSAGIVRHRCPLAVVSWSLPPPASPPQSPPAQGYLLSRIDDCRNVFPPLVQLPRTEAGLHVQQIFTVNQSTGLPVSVVNDSAILVSSLMSGINVECDGNVDPASISRPTCFLTVEIPGPTAPAGPGSPPQSLLAAYVPVSVGGNVSSKNNVITWLPSGGAAEWLPGIALQTPVGDRGILARFTLKGNFIWAPTTPPSFLDGEVFGFEQNGVTSLGLPSGDRRRGGTFETWFWLIAQPAALSSLALSQLQMFPGDIVTGTLSLTNPATTGLVVTLASSTPSVVTVPASVTFATGSTTANFPITAVAVGQGPVTITATLGSDSKTASVTVTPRPVTLAGLLLSSTIVTSGSPVNATINFSGPTATPAIISLFSSNPNVASVPPAVGAGPGSTSVNFSFGTSAAGVTVITATFGNSVTATLTVVKTKDKEKEKEKEIVKDKDFDKIQVEKIQVEKVARFEVLSDVSGLLSTSPVIAAPADGASAAANGRAFIRIDERPAIPPPV